MNDKTEISIIPSFRCNTNCSHCFLKNIPYEENKEKFLSQLEYILKNVLTSEEYIPYLFGGEPLLIDDDYFEEIVNKIIDNGYEFTLSTSLICDLSDKKISLIKKSSKIINTSFNFSRFNTEEKLNQWKINCMKLLSNGIKYKIMTTLDNDLILRSPKEFLDIVSKVKPYAITLETLVGFNQKQEDVDLYLKELYDIVEVKKLYDINIELFPYMKNKHIDILKRECIWHRTLYPDGTFTCFCPFGMFYKKYEPICVHNECKYQHRKGLPKELKDIILNEEL